MTIGAIAACIIIGLLALGGAGLGIYLIIDESKLGGIVTVAFSALVGISLIFGIIFFACNTESGKRAYKDQQSNFQGGISRTVTICDINGEILAQYSGKFDVETKDGWLLFDDEAGKRHMIYVATGTVIIDENG